MDFSAIMNLFKDSSWRGRVREGKGSFRGVPFFIIDDATLSGGRRVVRHEFPLRDDGETEDMGLKMRQYAFTAVVFGDDYFDKRDALVEAFEEEGGAELYHPYWDTQFIQIEAYTIRESCSAGGIAMFSVTCSPAVDDTAPVEEEEELLGEDSLLDSIIDDVTEVWDTVTGAIAEVEAVVAAVEQTVNLITNGIRGLAGATGLATLFGSALALKGAINNLINAPGQLFNDLKNLVGGIAKVGKKSSASRALSKTIVGIQTQTVSNDPAIARLQGVINTAVITMAMTELVGLTLTAAKEAAKAKPDGPALTSKPGTDNGPSLSKPPVVESEPPLIETLDDTKEAATDLGNDLLELLITTGDMGWFSTSNNLRTRRLVFLRQMMATAQNLPKSTTVALTGTEPALVMLYRHTGDVRQLDRFVRRNGIRYPAFVTGGVEVEIING